MVKRSPAPPSAGDSRYFTVMNPYPHQPYGTLEDSKKFAQWIACIVGQHNLIAFHHKPKSPNIVLLEVVKGQVDLRALLGAHRWGDFLKGPGKEEQDVVTSVFPCTMSTSWDLDKVRWIRCDVDVAWFKNWSPDKDAAIVHPYPLSRYCKPPAEDVTRTPLCRTIPQEMFRERGSTSGKQMRAATMLQPTARSSRSTPSVSSESSDWSSDELSSPPGLEAPIFAAPSFIPAIHGVYVPKSDAVIAQDAAAAKLSQGSLWNRYGDSAGSAAGGECAAHGTLCSRGICKVCGEKERVERRDKQMRLLQEERDAHRGHSGRTASIDGRSNSSSRHVHRRSPSSSSPDARSRVREDILVTPKGKPVRGVSVVAVTSRPLPPHLRKGAGKVATAAPPSPTSSYVSRATTAVPDDAMSSASSSFHASTTSSDVESVVEPISKKTEQAVPRNNAWATRKPPSWHAYAKIRADDDVSVASGATADAFRNPWKHTKPASAAPPSWADIVDEDLGEVPRLPPSRGPGVSKEATKFALDDLDEEAF